MEKENESKAPHKENRKGILEETQPLTGKLERKLGDCKRCYTS